MVAMLLDDHASLGCGLVRTPRPQACALWPLPPMHVDHAALVEEVVSEDLVPSCRQQQEPWYPDPPVSREVSLVLRMRLLKPHVNTLQIFPARYKPSSLFHPMCHHGQHLSEFCSFLKEFLFPSIRKHSAPSISWLNALGSSQ